MSQATALNPACPQALVGALLLHSIRLPLMVISMPGWDPWVGDVDKGPVPPNVLTLRQLIPASASTWGQLALVISEPKSFTWESVPKPLGALAPVGCPEDDPKRAVGQCPGRAEAPDRYPSSGCKPPSSLPGVVPAQGHRPLDAS